MKNLCVLFLLAALALAGCKHDHTTDNTSSFDQGPMLNNLADSLILPSMKQLAAGTASLKASADSFASSPSPAKLTALRQALRAAWMAWEAASPFDFGPASDQALFQNLNTFPPNTQTIESNISAGSWDLAQSANYPAKGFPGLDYLLFSDADSAQTVTKFSGSQNRRNYLQALVNEIDTKAQAAYSAWQGSYRSTFVSATGTAVGSSAGLYVNALAQEMDLLKNYKIGDVIGIRNMNTISPMQVEGYYSGWSKDLALENTRALFRAYKGQSHNSTEGPGLDDYLNASNAQATASSLQTQFQAAIAALQAVPGNLSTAATADNVSVHKAYDEHQKTLVLLKVDLPSALGILITFQDADGD